MITMKMISTDQKVSENLEKRSSIIQNDDSFLNKNNSDYFFTQISDNFISKMFKQFLEILESQHKSLANFITSKITDSKTTDQAISNIQENTIIVDSKKSKFEMAHDS